MKKIYLGLMVLLLVSSVFAQTDLTKELENNWKEIQGKELPGFVKTLFGNERINIKLTINEGQEIVLGLVTEDGKFKQIKIGAVEKPTLNVYGTDKVINEIKDSDNPLAAFRKALDEEKIKYSAIGITKKIKFGVISFSLRVASWFGFGKKG